MKRILPIVFVLSILGVGCVTARDSKKFERRLERLEKEVNRLRSEVLEAKGAVSEATGEVKALEENYRILLREVEKLKRNKKKR